MNTVAKTACHRCRDQKLKCSRELPQCARCLKFSVACSYPPPPDRKLLAASRAPPRKRLTSNGPSSKRAVHRHSVEHSPSNSTSFQDEGEVNEGLDESFITSADIETPIEVQDFFQEIYFTCQFHSSMLFHRPTFLRAFEEGQVPPVVLLAMYSNSIIFLPETSLRYRENVRLLSPLGDLKALGRRWALRAGRDALQSIDEPTLTKIQVCEMLALYWFSQGDFRRHTMFLSIAYKAACILGLDTNNCHATAPGPDNICPEWLTAEISRRCFWAVWFTQCISSDNYLSDIVFSDRVMDLPLPISESSFLRSRQEHPLRSLSYLQRSCENPEDAEILPNPSILGELLGIMLYWAKIRKLLEKRKRKSPTVGFTEVFELEAELSRWRSRLPKSFQYAKRTLNDQFVANQQSLYILMHVLHHQCRLVLHASLVPQFSGLELPKSVPHEVMSVSARIALSSAEEISCLASDLLNMDWDPAKIPAFIGYCLYTSATVHIAILGIGDPILANRARMHLVSTLKLLKSLKAYWTVVRKLWPRILNLYVTQMHHLRSANVQHQTTSPQSSHTGSETKNLDQLAVEVRDLGQLTEPLADTILEYSLAQLRPANNTTSHVTQEPNEANLELQLEELLQESPRPEQPLAANAFLSSEQRMGLDMGNHSNDHVLAAEPSMFEAELFDVFPDNSALMASWDNLGSTFNNPSLSNYNLFGFGGDIS